MRTGIFGALMDVPPAGKAGDFARPWIDYERASEYGKIIEVRPAKMQDPASCYVVYMYVIRFNDGTTKAYKSGHCEIKKADHE